MAERKTFFVNVILPIPVHKEFTYRVPFDMNELIIVGGRVIVPFGKSRKTDRKMNAAWAMSHG